MIVAIHQPHYLPWCGYLDKLDQADLFILLDTVPFSRGDWQNRNRFKTAQGWQWITVPVERGLGIPLERIRLAPGSGNWARKHRQALRTHYGAAPYTDWLAERLEPIWERPWERLAPLAGATVEALARRAGMTTPIEWASRLGPTPEHPDERLIALCRAVGADTYLSGPQGSDYMEVPRWREAGIDVRVQTFHHPLYPQLFGDFLPGMSAVDLLCHCGPDARARLREANGRRP